MSLNELIRFAKMHDIDFDKDIICVSQVEGEIDLDNVFFKEGYKKVDDDIYEKYSLRNWLKEIID